MYLQKREAIYSEVEFDHCTEHVRYATAMDPEMEVIQRTQNLSP